MSCYLLPQTICNNVKEETTLPLNVSLNNYLNTFIYKNECLDTKSIIHYIVSKHCTHSNYTDINHIDKSQKHKVIIDTSDIPNLTCLQYLEKKGCVILKITDSTLPYYIQLLYKLSFSFSEVFLYKPDSILHTSIKYAIALNFISIPPTDNLKIPYYFRMKLDDINSILGQNQLEQIIYKNI